MSNRGVVSSALIVIAAGATPGGAAGTSPARTGAGLFSK